MSLSPIEVELGAPRICSFEHFNLLELIFKAEHAVKSIDNNKKGFKKMLFKIQFSVRVSLSPLGGELGSKDFYNTTKFER